MPGEAEKTWIAIATTDERHSAELALVLTARGIEHQRILGLRGWELWVRAGDAPEAARELTEYRAENARASGSNASSTSGGPGLALRRMSRRCWASSCACSGACSISIGLRPAGSRPGACSRAKRGAR